MSTPFLGEIKIFSFNFPPRGWALCDGQVLPINQNQALFSILGTTYGGDGRTNFALPDLRSRIPVHIGNGQVLGEAAGEESVALTVSEMAAHSHTVFCDPNPGNAASPTGTFWAQDNNGNAPYSSSGGSGMSSNAISTVGHGANHINIAPYLTLNFCISLQGIFPSRS